MSISAVSSSSGYENLLSSLGSNSTSSSTNEIESEFEQLGSDLSSGDLSAAQQDFLTLTGGYSSAPGGSDPIGMLVSAFSTLSSDLQSGDLSAAQKEFTIIQSDLKNASAQGQDRKAPLLLRLAMALTIPVPVLATISHPQFSRCFPATTAARPPATPPPATVRTPPEQPALWRNARDNRARLFSAAPIFPWISDSRYSRCLFSGHRYKRHNLAWKILHPFEVLRDCS